MTGPLWWALFLVLAGLRALVLVGALLSGQLYFLALALPEGLALFYGCVNAVTARRVYTWGGLLPGFCYLLGLTLVPRLHNGVGVGSWLVAGGAVLSAWALLCLRTRFSVAGTAWVGLCDWGPYRVIRHPQLGARVLMVLGVLLGSSTIEQALGCVAALCVTAVVIAAEESELGLIPEWAAYRARVPWRVLPGVI